MKTRSRDGEIYRRAILRIPRLIPHVSCTPDGRRIVGAISSRNMAQVWDAVTGAELGTSQMPDSVEAFAAGFDRPIWEVRASYRHETWGRTVGNEMVDRGFDGARRVEGLGFVGLELFDVVHGKYRKIKALLYHVEHVDYQIDRIKRLSFT
jgi:hypothetical protein